MHPESQNITQISLLAILIILPFITLLGCTNGDTYIKGSGVVTTEARPISGITKITNKIVADITVSKSIASTLIIEADNNIISHIQTVITENSLIIQTPEGTVLKSKHPIKINIALPEVTDINLFGSGTIYLDSVLDRNSKLSLNGSGSITVAKGSGESISAVINGSGQLELAHFAIQNGTIQINGSGVAQVSASEQLTAKIAGSGRITYSGNPVENFSVNGSGKILKKSPSF